MKVFSHALLRPFRLGLALSLFLMVTGCGGSKGTISGKVLYKGEALKGGQVSFVSDSGGGGQASINPEDGSFKMEKVPLGPGTFAVQPPMNNPPPMMPSSAAPPKDVKLPGGIDPSTYNKRTKGADVKIPEKYKDSRTSELKYTVTGGSQDHNVELK
jgi:hypothetical protein